MSDPTNPLDPATESGNVNQLSDAIKALSAAFATLKPVLDAFHGGIGNIPKSAAEAKEGIKVFSQTLQDLAEKFGRSKIEQWGIQLDEGSLEKAEQVAKEGFDQLKESISTGTKEVNDFISSNRVNLAEIAAFDIASSALSKALSGISAIENKVLKPIKDIMPAIVDMGSSMELGAMSAQDFAAKTEGAYVGIARSSQLTGKSVEESVAAFKELAGSGLAVEDVFGNLNLTIGQGSEQIDGLSAAQRIASATGLQMGTVGKYIQENMRAMGRSGQETGEIFAALSLAQSKSGLSMASVSEAIMASARNLKYYGTNVEQLSSTFDAFIKSVGSGRQELGKELFSETVDQIENMNFGMKAFLGMQSSVGKGKGAIGAGLEFEQAIAEGNTEDIFGSIRKQLESFGGGQVLTRKDALASGQEQQYLMQRQLLGTVTGQSDTGKLDTMLGILQSGNLERSSEIFAPESLGKRKEAIFEGGQERIGFETGVAQTAVNRLRAEEAESLGATIRSYGMAADSMRNYASGFASSAADLGRKLVGVFAPGMRSDEQIGKDAREYSREQLNTLASGKPIDGSSREFVESKEAVMLKGYTSKEAVASKEATKILGNTSREELVSPEITKILGMPSKESVSSDQATKLLNFSNKDLIRNIPMMGNSAPPINLTPPPNQEPFKANMYPRLDSPIMAAPMTLSGVKNTTANADIQGADMPTETAPLKLKVSESLEIPVVFSYENGNLSIALKSMNDMIKAEVKKEVMTEVKKSMIN